ncbi:MAG TPA: tRNA (adenosine(37)-N6)-dimethylallyltransferase MiaA, partial [Thermopetrobacter sp.]|nr:tRNA (adenosine(37)-N6)-dimethylallyltransferase MiaA [Thermopetrobacter sp.]
ELGLPDAPADRQRLARALEVWLASGRPIAAFHGDQLPPLPDEARVARVFIAPQRERLRTVIARRFHEMLERGAVEEVKRLLERRLDPDLPAMKAHGVRNIAAFLRGEITLERAAAEAITETRQYAKRQMTWARKHMAHWAWAPDGASATRRALDLLDGDG